jgi:signal transduction histidine kinase
LGQANQDLIRINNDLDNFVYTASHDLKAPIANLEGFAILLSDRLRGRLDEKEMRLVEMIKAMTNRLKATIADLADISRVQKGQEQIPEPLSFEQMMEDTLADLRPIIEQSKAMINVDWQEEEIQYSRKHLRSILSNLIGNALKYRSSERQLEIHVRTYRAGENVVLSVADNGLGIPAHQLPKLFSMFKRFHSHVEGTGIGLYITKRTIENNGGKIEVESREGVGSTFYVYFKQ